MMCKPQPTQPEAHHVGPCHHGQVDTEDKLDAHGPWQTSGNALQNATELYGEFPSFREGNTITRVTTES